jgi:hypothetical protein
MHGIHTGMITALVPLNSLHTCVNRKAVMGLRCVMAPIIFRFRVLSVRISRTQYRLSTTQTRSVKILLMSVSPNF